MSWSGRQSHSKDAAPFGQILRRNGAMVSVDYFPADGETQSGALLSAGGQHRRAAKILEELVVLALGNSGRPAMLMAVALQSFSTIVTCRPRSGFGGSDANDGGELGGKLDEA